MAIKHNYSKERKPRNPYGRWNKIIEAVGKEKIKEIFASQGMYLASKEISMLMGGEVTPWSTLYIRYKLKSRDYPNA
jgi:hypothetical protein